MSPREQMLSVSLLKCSRPGGSFEHVRCQGACEVSGKEAGPNFQFLPYLRGLSYNGVHYAERPLLSL